LLSETDGLSDGLTGAHGSTDTLEAVQEPDEDSEPEEIPEPSIADDSTCIRVSITATTGTGEAFDVTIDPNETVMSLKDTIFA
jgi:hypothetical protein